MLTKFFSGLRTCIFLALALTVGTGFAQNDESALKMVKALRLGENLGGMSYNLAKLTTTYQGIAAKHGPQKADEMLRAELAISVPKHQEQWNRNLAQAWAPLMTREEFESIAAEKQKSPFSAKFVSLQNQAGAAMKAKSETLLTTVMSEALNRAFAR
jgi:hypothetical protein